MPVDKTFENEVKITNEERGSLDLTKQIEIKHKKLNGELRKEIDQLKKDAKEMLQYP